MTHFPISIIFLIISKFQFFDIDKLPIISEMQIYRLPIIFHRYIVHPYLWQNHPPSHPPFRHHRTIPSEKFPDCCIGKSRFINGDGGHFPWISRRKWNHQIWWQYRCWPIFFCTSKDWSAGRFTKIGENLYELQIFSFIFSQYQAII